jgi:hypothetical protein
VFGNDLVTRQNIMTQLVKRIVSPGHGPKPNPIPRQAVTRRGNRRAEAFRQAFTRAREGCAGNLL